MSESAEGPSGTVPGLLDVIALCGPVDLGVKLLLRARVAVATGVSLLAVDGVSPLIIQFHIGAGGRPVHTITSQNPLNCTETYRMELYRQSPLVEPNPLLNCTETRRMELYRQSPLVEPNPLLNCTETHRMELYRQSSLVEPNPLNCTETRRMELYRQSSLVEPNPLNCTETRRMELYRQSSLLERHCDHSLHTSYCSA